MSNRQKETEFLKTLILWGDSEQGQQLREKIKQAERDERCVRIAVWQVALVGLLALSGLGYNLVLVPEFTRFFSYFTTKAFCALGLGSFICIAIFLGLWLRYRAASNQVYDECRRFVCAWLESRLQPTSRPASMTAVESEACKVYRIETHPSQEEAELLQKAS